MEGPVNCKIGDLFAFEYGKSLTKKERKETGSYPVYGSNGIVGFHDEYLVEGPAIIIGRKGAVGEVEFETNNLWPIDTTYYVKVAEYLDFKYSYFLLKSLVLSRLDKSTAIPGLNRNDAYDLNVDLPPLPEQRAIVSRIEQLFSDLDNGIANLKLAQEQLKVYRQAVLKKAFEGELTRKWREQQAELPSAEELLKEIRREREEAAKASGKKVKPVKPLTEDEIAELPRLPEGWGWVKFNEACDIKSNLVSPENYKNYPHIAPDNIERETGQLLQYRTIEEDQVFSPKHLFFKDQIIYSKIRPYLNKLIIAPFDGLCSADMYPIESCMTNKYLFYYMLSKYFVNKASNSGSRTILPKINQVELGRIPLPFATIPEQHAIVQEIETRLSVCDKLEQDIAENLEKAEALRQSILKKAFEGKLLSERELAEVRRAEDWEPAEVLLERVRAEREKNGKI